MLATISRKLLLPLLLAPPNPTHMHLAKPRNVILLNNVRFAPMPLGANPRGVLPFVDQLRNSPAMDALPGRAAVVLAVSVPRPRGLDAVLVAARVVLAVGRTGHAGVAAVEAALLGHGFVVADGDGEGAGGLEDRWGWVVGGVRGVVEGLLDAGASVGGGGLRAGGGTGGVVGDVDVQAQVAGWLVGGLSLGDLGKGHCW